jgi:hypothetical protein
MLVLHIRQAVLTTENWKLEKFSWIVESDTVKLRDIGRNHLTLQTGQVL